MSLEFAARKRYSPTSAVYAGSAFARNNSRLDSPGIGTKPKCAQKRAADASLASTTIPATTSAGLNHLPAGIGKQDRAQALPLEFRVDCESADERHGHRA
jgi:hypothetical protein